MVPRVIEEEKEMGRGQLTEDSTDLPCEAFVIFKAASFLHLFSSPFSVINSKQTLQLLSYNIVGVEGKPRRTRVFLISMLAEHVIECWNNMYKTWIPTFSFLGVLLRITIWHFFFLTCFVYSLIFNFFLKKTNAQSLHQNHFLAVKSIVPLYILFMLKYFY